MMRKKIFILAVFSFIILLAIIFSIYVTIQQNDSKRQGKLVFSETYNRGHLVDKIELITAHDNVVLKQENSYWKVANNGNYFADFDLVHGLLSTINNSFYIVRLQADEQILKDNKLQDPLEEKEYAGMLIRTYIQDELLDEIIVSEELKEDQYTLARMPTDKDIWIISESFQFPKKAEDWFIRSLVSIPEEILESVAINDVEVKRVNRGSGFFDTQGKLLVIDDLLNVLGQVNITKALPESEFAKEFSFDRIDTITATTYYGLKYVFLFYSLGEEMWFEVKMETTSLPMTTVYDFISENSFLYEGWYFKTTQEQAFVFQNILRHL